MACVAAAGANVGGEQRPRTKDATSSDRQGGETGAGIKAAGFEQVGIEAISLGHPKWPPTPCWCRWMCTGEITKVCPVATRFREGAEKNMNRSWSLLDSIGALLKPAEASIPGVFLFIVLAGVCSGQTGYSSFGTNNRFASNSWCVSGSAGANCTTSATRYIAASFTPGNTLTLSSVAVAISNISGTNGAVINLMSNTSSGVPGAVLETWSVSNLPSSSQPPLTSVTSKINPTLQAGQTYWVEVQGLATDTMDVWYTNNLSLGGGMQDIN